MTYCPMALMGIRVAIKTWLKLLIPTFRSRPIVLAGDDRGKVVVFKLYRPAPEDFDGTRHDAQRSPHGREVALAWHHSV